MVAMPTGVRWNFNVVFIGIFFMAWDVEHFLIFFLLAIWTSSFKKNSVQIIGSLTFWKFSFLSFLYILVINPLSDV
jgi:hypothetical protein